MRSSWWLLRDRAHSHEVASVCVKIRQVRFGVHTPASHTIQHEREIPLSHVRERAPQGGRRCHGERPPDCRYGCLRPIGKYPSTHCNNQTMSR